MEGFRHVSGVPMLGSFALLGLALGTFGSQFYALLGLGVFVLDTGGGFWLAMATLGPRPDRRLR